MIDVDFQFRPVGQGAFYTGIFRLLNGKIFSFVYDCGTESSRQYINDEIISFSRSLKGNQLDLLFISHFHTDHTNKIRDLLNQISGVKKVIIPYLSPEEIILAITDGLQSESGLDPNTAQLIENPIEFFGDKVEEIIFVHPINDEESFSESLPIDPEPSDAIGDFNFSLVLKEKQDQQSTNRKVKHCYSGSYGVLNGIWKFQMYNKPRDTRLIQAFLKSLELLIGSVPNYQTITDFLKLNPIDFATFMQNIFRIHFGGHSHINNTSLIVNHHILRDVFSSGYHKKWLYFDLPGTLLTGDIILDNDTIADMCRSWNNRTWKKELLVFQIPHHGSENNMSFDLAQFPRTKWWIINFGLGNKHKHPHQQTINDITNNKRSGVVFCNTQLQGFRYGGKLV